MAPDVQLTQRHNLEGLPAVSSASSLDDVVSADYEAAVAHALEHRVQWVDDQLDYEFMDTRRDELQRPLTWHQATPQAAA